MPIFEYKCLDCGKITEVLFKTSKAENPVCEYCGSKKTQKQFSTFSAQVKESNPSGQSGCSSCPNQSCPHAGGFA